MQYQEKLMMQLWKNGKNPNFGPNLEPQKFKNDKKPNLVSDSGLFGPNLSHLKFPLIEIMHCWKLSLYVISRKNKEPD